MAGNQEGTHRKMISEHQEPSRIDGVGHNYANQIKYESFDGERGEPTVNDQYPVTQAMIHQRNISGSNDKTVHQYNQGNRIHYEMAQGSTEANQRPGSKMVSFVGSNAVAVEIGPVQLRESVLEKAITEEGKNEGDAAPPFARLDIPGPEVAQAESRAVTGRPNDQTVSD